MLLHVIRVATGDAASVTARDPPTPIDKNHSTTLKRNNQAATMIGGNVKASTNTITKHDHASRSESEKNGKIKKRGEKEFVCVCVRKEGVERKD